MAPHDEIQRLDPEFCRMVVRSNLVRAKVLLSDALSICEDIPVHTRINIERHLEAALAQTDNAYKAAE